MDLFCFVLFLFLFCFKDMMISCSGALAELKTGPLYFFDQVGQ